MAKIQYTANIEPEAEELIVRLAATENRSISNMKEQLLLEALASRGLMATLSTGAFSFAREGKSVKSQNSTKAI